MHDVQLQCTRTLPMHPPSRVVSCSQSSGVSGEKLGMVDGKLAGECYAQPFFLFNASNCFFLLFIFGIMTNVPRFP